MGGVGAMTGGAATAAKLPVLLLERGVFCFVPVVRLLSLLDWTSLDLAGLEDLGLEGLF